MPQLPKPVSTWIRAQKKSTTTNLVEFVTYCTSQIDVRAQVDAIYTDLKAAFDSLPHAILLAKLDKLGFPCSLVQWLKSYLINRTYIV